MVKNKHHNKIKTGQVWYSAGKNANRIILHVRDAGSQNKKQIAYVEYWPDKDRFIREGSCTATHLKYWGKLINQTADDAFMRDAFNFIVQSRKEVVISSLKDFASVIFNPKDQDSLQQMIRKVDEINNQPSGHPHE